MNALALGLFVVSAVALLGSPGPGIAALLAVGRAQGFARGLRYLCGLVLGLLVSLTVCAAGLISVTGVLAHLMWLLEIVATPYLLWLAWSIATSKVGEVRPDAASTLPSGVLLGLTNPKAYLAFLPLFASRSIVVDRYTDTAVKWVLIVAVILVVDTAWLMVGAGLHQARLTPRSERRLNTLFAALIAIAAIVSLMLE